MSQGLFARNDWAAVVRLTKVNAEGKVVPLEDGEVTAFLADSIAPDAVAIDPTLVGTVAYLGKHGDWLVTFDATILDPELLDPVIADATRGVVYLIVVREDGVRAYADVLYQASRPMVIDG
jgi:hypothetical protein